MRSKQRLADAKSRALKAAWGRRQHRSQELDAERANITKEELAIMNAMEMPWHLRILRGLCNWAARKVGV
jgi:hypothetical protein